MTTQYLPSRGDLIWVVFDPIVGREQAGRRPALVLSEKIFTQSSGLTILCPVTSKVRDIPSEVVLTGTKTKGVVLPAQVKSLDISERQLKFMEKAPSDVVEEAVRKVATFIGLPV